MAKFNRRATRFASAPSLVQNVIKTDLNPTGQTFEGAPGYARDQKSELFLLAVSNFEGEDTFYEKSNERAIRFRNLVRNVALADPQWTWRFLRWLRTEANIRTGAIVGALEAAYAMVKAKIPGARGIVSSVLVRADEPGEALAYWMSMYGRRLPKPVKRGIADAVRTLYTEFNWLKYDSTRSPVRFADVLELTHPEPMGARQDALFEYILNARHGRKIDVDPYAGLPMLEVNTAIRENIDKGVYNDLLDTDMLRRAGFTWEDALSTGGNSDLSKAQLWEAIIPLMGYMALIRNLRNFDEAGIRPAIAQDIMARLTDPGQVARSRQFPFRFLSAHRAVRSLRWAHSLEVALNLSLQNIPQLPGRTLVLVDRSGSMFGTLSAKSDLTRADQAAVFGAALALRNIGQVDLVEFGTSAQQVQVHQGDSLLRLVDSAFHNLGGTNTAGAVRSFYRNHDRVIIVTDEQSHDGDPGGVVPAHIPVYTWNLAGYKFSSTAGKSRRYTFGGLTDQSFSLIPLLEAGESQNWPF